MEPGAAKSFLLGIFAVAFSVLAPWEVSAENMDVAAGMPIQDVVAIMGQPDRKAVLEGKVLRDFTEVDPEGASSTLRVIYIYNKGRVQVWFQQGRVTGMTKDGVSVLRPKPP